MSGGGRDIGGTKSPLVVFAPFPPARSGIADYVAELMPYHLSAFDVTLVIADDAPLPPEPGPRTLLASEFRSHRGFFENAPKLYHIGNNPQHCYALDFIARDPGIVVLHDFNLAYLHEMATVKWDDREHYLRAMECEYGRSGRDLTRWQFESGFREIFTGYELPLNGGVLENATAIVTHSRQVQYKVAARVPNKAVWHVPHHLSPAFATYSRLGRAATRKRFGIPADGLVVTALGFVTRAKQIPLTLAALAALRGRVPPFRFVIAGERRPDEYDVDADIAGSELKDLTMCTDYLDDKAFFELTAATDIVVNLRYPSGGEMSGTLVRALGMGTPTVVLDYGPIGELPDHVVKKIVWDADVATSLADALFDLMTDADGRTTLGARAGAYIRDVHAIERMAERYTKIIRETPAAAVPAERQRQYFAGASFVPRKLRELGSLGIEAASRSEGRLWWSCAAAPLPEAGQRALVLSANPAETANLLALLFGWERSAIETMTVEAFLDGLVRTADGSVIPNASFSLGLAIVPSNMAEREAALLLRRLNAALHREAALVFETWTEDPGRDRRTSPLGGGELAVRLADAGFSETRLVSPHDGLLPELLLPADAGPAGRLFACATARKASDYAIWRFVAQHDGLPMRWGGRTGLRPDASAPRPERAGDTIS